MIDDACPSCGALYKPNAAFCSACGWRRVAVVASSVVFALLIFEVFLRVINFSYPTFYRPDPALGYALVPPAGWLPRQQREQQAAQQQQAAPAAAPATPSTKPKGR